MAVTVVTQTFTTIVNSRGRHLRRGLVDLLQQLDPQLNAALSKKVATGILSHPLVSGSNTLMSATGGTGTLAALLNGLRRLMGGPRLGNVVHREEFTKLLMGLAAVAAGALQHRAAESRHPARGRKRPCGQDQQLVRSDDGSHLSTVHGVDAGYHVRRRVHRRVRAAGGYAGDRQPPGGR